MDGQHDYLDAQLAGLPAKQQLEDYFTRMLAGLKSFTMRMFLLILDYGLRLFDITPEQLEAWESHCWIRSLPLQSRMILHWS